LPSTSPAGPAPRMTTSAASRAARMSWMPRISVTVKEHSHTESNPALEFTRMHAGGAGGRKRIKL
jgi:hypothetical protein